MDEWREQLEWIARLTLGMYRWHPWTLSVMANSVPPLGPNSVANYDRDLRTVDGLGLTDLEMELVVTMLAVYVQGAANTVVEAASTEPATGVSDQGFEFGLARLLDAWPPSPPPADRQTTADASRGFMARADGCWRQGVRTWSGAGHAPTVGPVGDSSTPTVEVDPPRRPPVSRTVLAAPSLPGVAR
ncbi:hypothetical protein BLA60_10785 [Actinophytocola xinjiangensis]|uniref:Tetracycline repressor TetR C-terminal domain-containing protein n=1 Tax=Actinophytocola xinjiangensis TaxID=485602 RepID=A0A7Z0WN46_9PSEU|nr:hypothetical protein BLA60_10785 [Actinophytocola xinjiangensis]